jgi:hypothetical protein
MTDKPTEPATTAPRYWMRNPTAWLPLLSLAIAALSLGASISQSYNYRRNIDSAQRNVLRTENLKTCRDIIEVFFAFRLKAEEANMLNEKGGDVAQARRELKSQVYRFGALGTFLANFTPDAARLRYTQLSWLLNDIAEKGIALPQAAFESRFAEADAAFATLNDDCVASTRVE